MQSYLCNGVTIALAWRLAAVVGYFVVATSALMVLASLASSAPPGQIADEPEARASLTVDDSRALTSAQCAGLENELAGSVSPAALENVLLRDGCGTP